MYLMQEHDITPENANKAAVPGLLLGSGEEQCEADGTWFCCKAASCNLQRACASMAESRLANSSVQVVSLHFTTSITTEKHGSVLHKDVSGGGC